MKGVPSELCLSLLQSGELLAQLPESGGVFWTLGRQRRPLLPTVHVVSARLAADALLYAAEDGGLCPRLRAFYERPHLHMKENLYFFFSKREII